MTTTNLHLPTIHDQRRNWNMLTKTSRSILTNQYIHHFHLKMEFAYQHSQIVVEHGICWPADWWTDWETGWTGVGVSPIVFICKLRHQLSLTFAGCHWRSLAFIDMSQGHLLRCRSIQPNWVGSKNNFLSISLSFKNSFLLISWIERIEGLVCIWFRLCFCIIYFCIV